MAIAGHDQDWDDTIRAAHDEARRLLCRPTLWWRAGGEFTGQWRYVPQGASPARATPP
jgi:hypothetical protein